ncbi:hypothetical protein J437_LFUL013988 [Ladona fulva]|uniref:Endonuclease/exonuclease/phosphatase domain-containing protein n=1 Tax=Ladona fulva TaxID=123851 RepID=A0A8K0P3L8_LADFU|nr:hypothetical protein J437_LFUL013988 [Ladona fulva]
MVVHVHEKQHPKCLECLERDGVFSINTRIAGTNIANVCKPPQVKWPSPPMPIIEHPCLFIGDFNRHRHAWGYEINDENGTALHEGSLSIRPGGEKNTHQTCAFYQDQQHERELTPLG